VKKANPRQGRNNFLIEEEGEEYPSSSSSSFHERIFIAQY
jgi:hypothetical protein